MRIWIAVRRRVNGSPKIHPTKAANPRPPENDSAVGPVRPPSRRLRRKPRREYTRTLVSTRFAWMRERSDSSRALPARDDDGQLWSSENGRQDHGQRRAADREVPQ